MNKNNIKADNEVDAIIKRYKRRGDNFQNKYNLLNPYVYLSEQEKERAIINCFNRIKIRDFSNKKVLEIGCGSGHNLLLFLKLGFNQNNIFANDLLENRLEKAKTILPPKVHFYCGDARSLNLPDNYFDILLQSVVFTSILNQKFKTELAGKMWNLTKPGGGILWIDFIYNNPFNPDVRGIRFKEIKELFPNASIIKWKIILAPPLGRFITRINPVLYNVCNSISLFRTHLLCWIEKKYSRS